MVWVVEEGEAGLGAVGARCSTGQAGAARVGGAGAAESRGARPCPDYTIHGEVTGRGLWRPISCFSTNLPPAMMSLPGGEDAASEQK